VRSIPNNKEHLKAENIDHSATAASNGNIISNLFKKLLGK
jgi:hypothetical protein